MTPRLTPLDRLQALFHPRIKVGGRLFRKYVGLFVGVVCLVLIVHSLFASWIAYRDQKAFLVRLQLDNAAAAADKIGAFVREVETQIGWTTQLPWTPSDLEDRHVDAVRLLRQMSAITRLVQIDRAGREQLRVSQSTFDETGSNAEFVHDIRFTQALAKRVFYGPVYFFHGSEPHMEIALAGERSDSLVSIADLNLKFIRDLVTQIKVGAHGTAYLIDAQNRLIAHPDISLVLRNIDLSELPQVRAARSHFPRAAARAEPDADIFGRPVLTAYAPVNPLGWIVFIEEPLADAYASLYASLAISGMLLLGALVIAVVAGLFLARRMIVPIEALRAGAMRLGGGDLGLRLSFRTGDELEALGDQFNAMAARLQELYATLERKVEERTQELALANLAKSRFLAAASHDLRQPLHALGLFVAQLRTDLSPVDRSRIIDRIGSAVETVNELFGALLDISKLDAGVLDPELGEFPIAHLLQRMDTTFATAARGKGLRFRIVPCGAWVRSDVILLERVLLNLVSNATRYTDSGGVVVGCRRGAETLRIEVWDSGSGIPHNQQQKIFREFYRLDEDGGRRGGLGLGLAIVERFCRLLDHPVEVVSEPGKGSRFTVTVPLAAARQVAWRPHVPPPIDRLRGKIIMVVDDDALVLESMEGLLRDWKCRVIVADSYETAMAAVTPDDPPPDAIICDYHLADGRIGIEVIEALRHMLGTPVPAVLISGDIDAERATVERGYQLLHKPVGPIALRSLLNQL